MTHAEVSQWVAFRNKRGSFFIGRRVEQSIGNWMAHYTRFKVKEGEDVDPLDFMPHEEVPELTFEEERMKAIRKKSG